VLTNFGGMGSLSMNGRSDRDRGENPTVGRGIVASGADARTSIDNDNHDEDDNDLSIPWRDSLLGVERSSCGPKGQES
jgi:hypothetical protein